MTVSPEEPYNKTGLPAKEGNDSNKLAALGIVVYGVTGIVSVEGIGVKMRIITVYTRTASWAEDSIFINAISAVFTKFHSGFLSKKVWP